eukprot:TRINITY_DN1943_c0_g1_i2.p1 TRINITY_DN1943_c0_g1~~TRINITY_DN1943_c0_g1_i2.p1  ORF type:complete len:296 (-),score=39.92 TRINITY_DN1943_c0_g1_i2:112-999(-)
MWSMERMSSTMQTMQTMERGIRVLGTKRSHVHACLPCSAGEILPSKKYGVDLPRFTHHSDAVIVAPSLGTDKSIRYWSVRENKFIRCFRKHRENISSLCMSPVGDEFISCSHDNSLILWDLRSPVVQGVRGFAERPYAAFDPAGSVVAVASSSQLCLFDVRRLDARPFATKFLTDKEQFQSFEPVSLRFSPDGNSILCCTTGDVFVFDAYHLEMQKRLSGAKNEEGGLQEASFSPNSEFVACGSDDSSVYIWSAATGKTIRKMTGHVGPVRSSLWNERYALLATACHNVALWIPR